jgi:radical SAM protein with 4Fe4S-binding SPASM domain
MQIIGAQTATDAHAASAKGYAVGIGLTNECDLSCAHCYRNTLALDRLNLNEVQKICQSLPVASVNLGVGENGLHPQYHEILAWLHTAGIRTAVTSNGYSIEVLSDAEVARLHSVEFSLDFPTETEQDTWRAPNNWQKCIEGIKRCRRLGVPVAVMTVMMSTNYNRLSELARVAAQYDADFRFNLYQPVNADYFSLSYEQFWDGIIDLLENSLIISLSEPLVNALIGFTRPTSGSPCGRTSVRVLPNGSVTPCTYWASANLRLSELYRRGAEITGTRDFQDVQTVPDACQKCPFVETCGGGCASRRRLRGKLNEPDEYCPVVRGDNELLARLANLNWQAAPFRDMPKAGNACTFMVKAR